MVQLLVVLAVAVLGSAGLFAYLTARRTTKGTVNTSDARTIWDQANSIRQSLEGELTSLRMEVATYRNEAIDARNDAMTARNEALNMREEHAKCQRQVRQLNRRLKALET